MKVLTDSDILIEVARGRDRRIVRGWMDLSLSGAIVLFSPVNAAELWAGARANEHEKLSRLFANLTCVAITADVGEKAGQYLRQFAKSHALELGDALIAATAVELGASLWTRNRKHYPMKEIAFFEDLQSLPRVP